MLKRVKSFLVLVAVCALVSCQGNKPQMKVNIDCSELGSKHAYVACMTPNGIDTLASFDIVDGSLIYCVDVDYPRYTLLYVENLAYPFALITEPGEYNLKLMKTGAYTYDGGTLHNKIHSPYKDAVYLKYVDIVKEFYSDEYWKDAPEEEKKRVNEINLKSMERLDTLFDQLRTVSPEYALFVSEHRHNLGNNPKEVIKSINTLDPEKYKNERARWNSMYEAQVEQEKSQAKYAVGKSFDSATVKDREGADINLKEVWSKNKFTMIEFWASWCGPCRDEIPVLKKDYTEYNEKGFEIVSISVDSKESKWLSALDEEKLEWLNGRDTEKLSIKYGVQGIPANWVLDENGKVVAKDLRGEALGEFLKEHLQ
ncbi:TlpA family protein disulfide reductase [Flavobacteriaceae bacterium]|nr:TlpA family protein disulfide reductase [Flavobacteriaceae bacterium]